MSKIGERNINHLIIQKKENPKINLNALNLFSLTLIYKYNHLTK